MNSQELIIKLKKKGLSGNNIGNIIGRDGVHVSNVLHKRRNFSITELNILVEEELISEKQGMNIHWNDRKNKMGIAASFLMTVGSLQVVSQVQEVYYQLCILC